MHFTDPNREAKIRQDVCDSLARQVKNYFDGLEMTPIFVIEAIEKQIWKMERITAGGTRLEPIGLGEFIRSRYPVGLGSTPERIRQVIAHHPGAVAAWEEALASEA